MFLINHPILLYHRITKGTPPRHFGEYAISEGQFEREMKFLHTHGYICLSLADLLLPSDNIQSSGRRAVALTFDDGYEDFYTIAFPILKKYGFTATVFLITNFTHEQNDSQPEEENRYLSWTQIETLQQSGISFGSHTCTHSRLPSLKPDEIQSELNISKECLEVKLGQKIQWLSYPYSVSTQEIQRMAEEAGYMAAFGVDNGKGNRYNIWRHICTRDEPLVVFDIKLKRWSYFFFVVKEHSGIIPLLRKIRHNLFSEKS